MALRTLGTEWSGPPFRYLTPAHQDEILQLLTLHGVVRIRRQEIDVEGLWQVARQFGRPIDPVPLDSPPAWVLNALSDEARGYRASSGPATLVKGPGEWRLLLKDLRIAANGREDIVAPLILFSEKEGVLSAGDGGDQVDIFETVGDGGASRADVWHSDASFLEQPPSIGLFYAESAPEDGSGATMFCDTSSPLDRISPVLRDFLASCTAVHAADAHLRRYGERRGSRLTIPAVPPPVEHPIVRRFDELECLFVNPFYTDRISGMNYAESNALLEHLYELCTSPEFTYTHRWEPGDIVLWDNRSTMHYSLRNVSEGRHKRLLRAMVGGERPVAAGRGAAGPTA